jgi:hypothetical protein
MTLDGRQDRIDVIQHIMIPEANNLVAMKLQDVGPIVILLETLRVLSSINFGHQLGIEAAKVRNEAPNRNLSAELHPRESPASEVLP